MMFLIRLALWLGIVLAFLPSFGSDPLPTSPQGDLSPYEAASAATATVSDMRHFCTRQPEACAVGAQAVTAFGQRAQAGAKMVYDYIVERLANGDGAAAGIGAKSAAAQLSKPSQQTLTPADLMPAWRGPTPRRDGRAAGDA